MTARRGPARTAAGVPRPGGASEAHPLRPADLLALSVGTFTLGVDGFVLCGLLPQVSASLHVSPSTAGQLTTLFALVYALSSPLIAAAAGAWDRRRLLVVGMAVFMAGIVVQATGPSFAVVAAGRILAALGAAAYQATAYSTAGILSDDEHRVGAGDRRCGCSSAWRSSRSSRSGCSRPPTLRPCLSASAAGRSPTGGCSGSSSGR